MITKLDELVGADHGDKDFQEKFYEMLVQKKIMASGIFG